MLPRRGVPLTAPEEAPRMATQPSADISRTRIQVLVKRWSTTFGRTCTGRRTSLITSASKSQVRPLDTALQDHFSDLQACALPVDDLQDGFED